MHTHSSQKEEKLFSGRGKYPQNALQCIWEGGEGCRVVVSVTGLLAGLIRLQASYFYAHNLIFKMLNLLLKHLTTTAETQTCFPTKVHTVQQ